MNHNDIWKRLCVGRLRIDLGIFCDRIDRLFAITLRLLDTGVEHTRHKAVWQTVILIGKRHIPEIGRQDSLLGSQLRHERNGHKERCTNSDRDQAMDLALILTAAAPESNEPDGRSTDSDQNERQFQNREITRRDRDRFRNCFQILRVKRRHTLQEQCAVDDSQKEPQKRHQHPGECTAFKDIAQAQRHKDQISVIQKDQRRACHISRRFDQ